MASTNCWTWRLHARSLNSSARSTTPSNTARASPDPPRDGLIRAAHEQQDRFGGIITTQRQAKALLSDPALTVFDNADAYLSCNYDPSKALCNPARTSGPKGTPSLDRCQINCSNIARTDLHAQHLRTKAEQLRVRADSVLSPHPVAERLRHRAASLIERRQTRPHPHHTHRPGASMSTDQRVQIHAAINRLLAGTPLRSDSDGALTVVSLATEADVKRHVLTHRHTDLKDEFYARVRAQGHTPASEQQLRDELEVTRHKLTEAREEIRDLNASIEAFARIVKVLTVENDRLVAQSKLSRTDAREGTSS